MQKPIHPVYLCPICLKPFAKDHAVLMLSANVTKLRGLNGANPKEITDTIKRVQKCQGCGAIVDAAALLDGRLDYHGYGARIGTIAGIVAFVVAINLPHPPALWLSALLAFAVAGLSWFGADLYERIQISRWRKDGA
jgi:hypothetical protein